MDSKKKKTIQANLEKAGIVVRKDALLFNDAELAVLARLESEGKEAKKSKKTGSLQYSVLGVRTFIDQILLALCDTAEEFKAVREKIDSDIRIGFIGTKAETLDDVKSRLIKEAAATKALAGRFTTPAERAPRYQSKVRGLYSANIIAYVDKYFKSKKRGTGTVIEAVSSEELPEEADLPSSATTPSKPSPAASDKPVVGRDAGPDEPVVGRGTTPPEEDPIASSSGASGSDSDSESDGSPGDLPPTPRTPPPELEPDDSEDEGVDAYANEGYIKALCADISTVSKEKVTYDDDDDDFELGERSLSALSIAKLLKAFLDKFPGYDKVQELSGQLSGIERASEISPSAMTDIIKILRPLKKKPGAFDFPQYKAAPLGAGDEALVFVALFSDMESLFETLKKGFVNSPEAKAVLDAKWVDGDGTDKTDAYLVAFCNEISKPSSGEGVSYEDEAFELTKLEKPAGSGLSDMKLAHSAAMRTAHLLHKFLEQFAGKTEAGSWAGYDKTKAFGAFIEWFFLPGGAAKDSERTTSLPVDDIPLYKALSVYLHSSTSANAREVIKRLNALSFLEKEMPEKLDFPEYGSIKLADDQSTREDTCKKLFSDKQSLFEILKQDFKLYASLAGKPSAERFLQAVEGLDKDKQDLLMKGKGLSDDRYFLRHRADCEPEEDLRLTGDLFDCLPMPKEKDKPSRFEGWLSSTTERYDNKGVRDQNPFAYLNAIAIREMEFHYERLEGFLKGIDVKDEEIKKIINRLRGIAKDYDLFISVAKRAEVKDTESVLLATLDELKETLTADDISDISDLSLVSSARQSDIKDKFEKMLPTGTVLKSKKAFAKERFKDCEAMHRELLAQFKTLLEGSIKAQRRYLTGAVYDPSYSDDTRDDTDLIKKGRECLADYSEKFSALLKKLSFYSDEPGNVFYSMTDVPLIYKRSGDPKTKSYHKDKILGWWDRVEGIVGILESLPALTPPVAPLTTTADAKIQAEYDKAKDAFDKRGAEITAAKAALKTAIATINKTLKVPSPGKESELESLSAEDCKALNKGLAAVDTAISCLLKDDPRRYLKSRIISYASQAVIAHSQVLREAKLLQTDLQVIDDRVRAIRKGAREARKQENVLRNKLANSGKLSKEGYNKIYDKYMYARARRESGYLLSGLFGEKSRDMSGGERNLMDDITDLSHLIPVEKEPAKPEGKKRGGAPGPSQAMAKEAFQKMTPEQKQRALTSMMGGMKPGGEVMRNMTTSFNDLLFPSSGGLTTGSNKLRKNTTNVLYLKKSCERGKKTDA